MRYLPSYNSLYVAAIQRYLGRLELYYDNKSLKNLKQKKKEKKEGSIKWKFYHLGGNKL